MRLANGNHVLVLDLHFLIVAMKRLRILATTCRMQRGEPTTIDGNGELDPAAAGGRDEIPSSADLRLILKMKMRLVASSCLFRINLCCKSASIKAK